MTSFQEPKIPLGDNKVTFSVTKKAKHNASTEKTLYLTTEEKARAFIRSQNPNLLSTYLITTQKFITETETDTYVYEICSREKILESK